MSRLFRLSVIAAVLLAALALAACGSKKTRLVPQLASEGTPPTLTQPATAVSLDDALTELDALPTPEGVDEALFAELKEALQDALSDSCRAGTITGGTGVPPVIQVVRRRDACATKLTSTPPTGEANRVNDLGITDNGDGTFTLSWHYRNLGDYDQNGTVAVEDIIPLALHYGEEVLYHRHNSLQAVIDGSNNGCIGIEDITPIAVHLTEDVHHYAVEGASSADEPWEWIRDVALEEGTGEGRKTYEAILDDAIYQWYRVVTVDAEGNRAAYSTSVWLQFGPAAPLVTRVSPTLLLAGAEASFKATVKGTGPFDYEWEFGDAATPSESNDPEPTVTIGPAGQHVCRVRVSNDYGTHLFTFSVTVSADYGDWRMEGRDAQHTRCSPFIGPSSPVVKWMLPFEVTSSGGREGSFNALGTIYILCRSHSLYAVNPWGMIEWDHELRNTLAVTPAVAADGTIYAPDMYHTISAFSPDGTVKWNFAPGLGGYWSSPTIGVDGTIYAVHGLSSNSYLYAITPEGDTLWTCSLEGGEPACPALASDRTVYIGTNAYELSHENGGYIYTGYLHAIGAPGNLKWSYSVEDRIRSGVSVGKDGTIYLGCNDNHIYAINPDGSLKWLSEVSDDVKGGPAIAKDGTILISCRNGRLHALSPDGTPKWEREHCGSSHPVIDADGCIYASSSRQVVALHPDGTLKWQFDIDNSLGGNTGISMALDGSLYVHFPNGELYAFSGCEQVPLAISSVSPQNGLASKPTAFSFIYSGSTPTEYFWDFGGGAEPSTSEEENPIVTLGTVGEYDASLTIRNEYNEDIFPFTLTVREVPHEPWVHTWGTERYEYASALAVDCSGSIWVAGSTALLKYSPCGELILANSWEYDSYGSLIPSGIVMDTSGYAYIVVYGTGVAGVLLLRFDQAGSLLWNRTWTGHADSAYGMTLDEFGNALVVGETFKDTGWFPDIMLLKYDSEGNLLFSKALRMELIQSATSATHSGARLYVVGLDAGWGYCRGLVAAFDCEGQFLWGRYCENAPELTTVGVDSAGNLYTAGRCYFNDSYGILLFKINGEGSVLWSKLLCSPTNSYSVSDIITNETGDLYIVGSSVSTLDPDSPRGLLFLKLSAEGRVLRSMKWQPVDPQSDGASGYALCVDGEDVYIAGGAPNIAACWHNVVTLALPLSVSLIPFDGAVEEVTGSEGSLELTESPVQGVIDQGGGGWSDFLLLKNYPP